VVADILRGNRIEIAGCVCPRDTCQLPDVSWLGEDNDEQALRTRGLTLVHVAVGDNAIRRRVALGFLERGFRLASAVSDRAAISPTASIGTGAAVMPGAVINAYAQIGTCAIVNTAASVDHDCRVGDYAHIAPGCHLAGNVIIGEGTFVGIGASVISGISIGDWSVVGAGGVVIRSLPAGVTAAGVPARAIKYNK
jgi:UDP-perosamine 4-acetyltransferase